jgi:WD repeat and SOF domain-containing protein 1
MASEDHNLYTFDIRNLETPTQIYKGHVAGVMGCEWSPTGEEFVSGGWDRTVRLWNRDAGKSRDVYHTKRMQRYVCTFHNTLPAELTIVLALWICPTPGDQGTVY